MTKIKASTPDVAPNNPFKDVFGPAAAERKQLINKIKGIHAKRNELRGVSGTKEQWNALTKEMHSVQNRINELNVQLGIEVKVFPAPVDKKHFNEQKTGRLRTDRKQGEFKHYKGRPQGGFKRGEAIVVGAETSADKSRVTGNLKD
ncbi:hypothetical protein OBP_188 [Pseudomonas phage OBP]|uniref:hypothetical protein n=1 Tax=Pseudomonas phage OBP TaxID=1124849 RepID=UPI000240D59C|nr:hypothetical protein OBP_188 [Pseudomonas phage OBP]AEV89625.1 hypothetical protein OBP_188 [Pseudomonas phage OBP]